MTTKGKGYDPFAFGQVKLGSPGASAGASPEDVLFADTGGPEQGGADTSWDPPEQFAETGAPAVAKVAARPPAPQVSPRPTTPRAAASVAAAVPPREDSVPVAQPAAAAPARTTDSGVRIAAAASVRSAAPVALPAREPAGPVAVIVPFVVLAAVEGVALWLWVGQSNPVLGGLAAVLGLGLSALGFCALRR